MPESLPDDRTMTPPARLERLPVSKSASALSVPLTPLIGREHDLDMVCNLLQNTDSRLVTLTGPGGVGKTRLAREVAVMLQPWFKDDVWFLSLETVRDPDRFVRTVADALGVGDSGERSRFDRLLARLRDSETLLVLDNFEQILHAAPALVQLLEACPRVRALVTSRAVLHVTGELDVTLPPLSVPASGDSGNTSVLRENAAIRLFESRARLIDPRLALSNSDLPIVAEICRRLDGLPLAIELAAARRNVLSPEDLLARLDQRLPLLVGGARDLPERLRTMRAAIAWSYDLLSPEEQHLFRRLSVFNGGCTIETALALCDDVGELSVIDGIGALVDASLVRRDDTGHGPRFSMLETIREFAATLLSESGEDDAVQRRHAQVITNVAEGLSAKLDGGVVKQALLDHADAEMPNVLSALDWCRHAGEWHQALQLAGAIAPYWLFKGFLAGGVALLEEIVACTRDAPATLRARALRALGMLYRPLRDEARGVACLEESVALERIEGDSLRAALSLNFLGVVLLGQGDYDRAEAAWDEALSLFRERNEDEPWIDHILHHQGLLCFGKDDPVEATRLLEEALSRHRTHGDARGEASSLLVLALVSCASGDVKRASFLIHEAMDIWELLGMMEGLAGCFAATVVLAHATRRPQDAVCFQGMTEAICETSGFQFTLPERATYDAVYAALRSALPDSAWRPAFTKGRAMTQDEAISAVRQFLREIAESSPSKDSHAAALPFGLSPREVEVLSLVAVGRPDREIAEELYVSLRTVQTHVSHILTKLGVRSRAEAAAVAVRHGIA